MHVMDLISVLAVSFLVGIGVKVFYGAREKTIEVLAKRMGIESMGQQRSTIIEFLSEELTGIDKAKNPENSCGS